jgi:hypothetical protein
MHQGNSEIAMASDEARLQTPLRASHTFSVLSQLAEAKRWPSGLKATLVTPLVCPLSVMSSWPL